MLSAWPIPTPNFNNAQGRTTLHMATTNGHIDFVKYLIDTGVDLNSANEGNITPLH
ncbi:ankyrin domain protein [Medicago truncatula]|uniref:Ankyrin domain protein n=1 Tax=Medicago truncatula TaxID=3880 RepID=G7ICS6_MEDTR|nr:ankyrin domain protein [Medicago truncatula]